MRLWKAAALACWAVLAGAQTASQSQKFQEAIDAMETRGDCPLAIRLFEEAARGPDRNLAAHALFEKLGKQEAQKLYERVFLGRGGLSAQTISFVARRDFGTARAALSVAVADFNGAAAPARKSGLGRAFCRARRAGR